MPSSTKVDVYASIRHGVSRSILVIESLQTMTLDVTDVLMSFPQSSWTAEAPTCFKHAWVNMKIELQTISRSNSLHKLSLDTELPW